MTDPNTWKFQLESNTTLFFLVLFITCFKYKPWRTLVLIYIVLFSLFRESEDELATSTRRLQQKLDDVEHSHAALQRKYSSLEGDLAASTQECTGLKSTVAQMTSAQAGMQAQLSATQVRGSKYMGTYGN